MLFYIIIHFLPFVIKKIFLLRKSCIPLLSKFTVFRVLFIHPAIYVIVSHFTKAYIKPNIFANNKIITEKGTVIFMFKHEKQLFHPVGIERPNPQYAVLMQEQLGGGNGELKAAMQYMSQSFRIKDPEIKDLFLDIAAEELGHMEMVAQTINLLNGHDVDSFSVSSGEIQTHVQNGLAPGLINSSGYSWTADYVTVTGDLCADLLSNIASEQRAKVVYEYLYRQIEDKRVRETIDFLLNREEAHNQMFRDAFNKVQNSGSNRDFGTTKAAKMYFSMSEPGNNAFASEDTKKPEFV